MSYDKFDTIVLNKQPLYLKREEMPIGLKNRLWNVIENTLIDILTIKKHLLKFKKIFQIGNSPPPKDNDA